MPMQIAAFFFPSSFNPRQSWRHISKHYWSPLVSDTPFFLANAREIYALQKIFTAVGDINETLYILRYKITRGAYLTTLIQVH